MNQDTSLLADSPNTTWSFEKATPFPATNAYYRSRIYTANVSINPLIAACDQILSLATILAKEELPNDRNKLLDDLAHEIRSFEHRAQIANYQSNIIVAARFALCSLLDEIIKSTSWGQNNNWPENNLLTLFHNENCGDTRFFTIIDRALENIGANLHLIELLYICLNLGFTGKYKESPNGQNELIAITSKLYQAVRHHGSDNRKNILIGDKKVESKQNHITPPKFKKVNTQKLLWLTTAFAFITSAVIYIGIGLKLGSASKPAYSAIEQIMKERSEI